MHPTSAKFNGLVAISLTILLKKPITDSTDSSSFAAIYQSDVQMLCQLTHTTIIINSLPKQSDYRYSPLTSELVNVSVDQEMALFTGHYGWVTDNMQKLKVSNN